MKKLVLPGLGLGALLVAALIPLVADSLKKGAVEVYLLIPHQDPATIEANEFFFEAKPGDADFDKKYMGIYGVPTESKEWVIVDTSKVVSAKAKPELKWLPVDKAKGENPLQVKTVDFVARMLKGGAVEVGMLFLVLFVLLRLGAPAPGARSAAAE